jgi:hypothetical protein
MLRAITVYQPWTTLLTLPGVKAVETRSWRSDYRGPILLHAARRWTRKERVVAQDLHRRYPQHIPASIYQPVLGAVLAVGDLMRCARVEDLVAEGLHELEIACGDYSPGRFGFVLSNMRVLRSPVPVRGWMRLWTPKPELVRAIEAEL